MLSFNKFEHEGRRFYQQNRIGLKGDEGSFIRHIVPLELHRSMNIPVQRSSYAQLFINDVNYGLYWMSEEINGSFLRSRFTDHKQNIYKNRGGNMTFIGNDPNLYKALNYTLYKKINRLEYQQGIFKITKMGTEIFQICWG
jgi:spore coat protein CotH